MLRKRNEEKKVLAPVDIKTGIELLQKQIEDAKSLLDNRPIKPKDHQAWNKKTEVYLMRIYGERSPNVDTIVEAAGSAPAWLFMPDDVAERCEASRLENKIRLLEGCVVTLKRREPRIV